MTLFELPGYWLVVVNSVAWLLVYVGLGNLSQRWPDSICSDQRWLFRTRPWEREGAIYDDVLGVKRWKSALPSGATLFRSGFSLTRVLSQDCAYLKRWVRESCRAELTHWLAMLPLPLFFLWNPTAGDVLNVAYALAFNVPCILVQRYNRPRLLAILRKRCGQA
jgi:glycosyl-4,4'-diaponeurosporenoate acyltransferase